jgi:hypothetical protein
MRGQAKTDAFDYIERFYNHRRRHSASGGLSPVKFEMLNYASIARSVGLSVNDSGYRGRVLRARRHGCSLPVFRLKPFFIPTGLQSPNCRSAIHKSHAFLIGLRLAPDLR